MAYCIDTSFWIKAWSDLYRPSKFPSIWENIGEMIAKNEIVSPMEVKNELKPKDKKVLAWLDARSSVFQELNEKEQRYLTELLGRFPNLVAEGITQPADPYVVAMAKIRGITVVTDERPSGGMDLRKNPFAAKKIPDVCAALEVPCLSVSEFINCLPGEL